MPQAQYRRGLGIQGRGLCQADRAEHHLFQPLLYQCATGILSVGKIAAPLRQLLGRHRNVEFVIAEVSGIDPDRRRVLARRPLGEQIESGYDYLILARYDQFFALSSRWGDVTGRRRMDRGGSTGRSKSSGGSGEVGADD